MDYLPTPSSSKMNIILSVTTVFICVMAITIPSHGLVIRERKPNPRSCSEAGMCCQGQNNTCFALGERIDLNSVTKKCFCDSNCLIMGDCCTDYVHTCKSVNCIVGTWTEWSECNNPCGYGTRRRTRDVDQYPDNGGETCPSLKQRRACVGYEKAVCDQNLLGEQIEEKAEQARILPISFGNFRNSKEYNPWKGILKNLRTKHINQIFTRAAYTATFTVKKAHYGCKDSEWAKYLEEGKTVCVECQPVAMNRDIGMRCLGHGVFGAETQWTAVGVEHCHGSWIMNDKHKPAVCEYNVDSATDRNFIFI